MNVTTDERQLDHSRSTWPTWKVTRRDTLCWAGGAALVAASISACDLLATDPSDDRGDEPAAEKGLEAPVLSDQVDAGDLPPLEERLPETPLVVEPVHQTGVYGGTWRSALLGPADTAWLRRTILYDPLLTWDREFTEPIPNIAQGWEISGGGREFEFSLRPGMKWSDGEPFTAHDIAFAYNDIFGNEELYPLVPDWLRVEDEPATVEVVDDMTIRFVFVRPSGLFLARLAEPSGLELVTRPRHYLEEFHADYNSEAADLAEEQGYADWTERLFAEIDWGASAELPTINAWRITEPVGEGTRLVAERNPYYWKTDPEGSQLPYLEQVVFDVVQDEQVMLLNAANGELDMHVRHFNVPQNKPTLADSRDSGDYDFFEVIGPPNDMTIFLNLTHQDSVLRDVFSNKDFRVGLSHAINREEIIDAVYQRQGEPWQIAPHTESPLFDEEMAKQYTEYDVDLANEYLDRAGYTERDGDDFRLRPDGERISFQVDISAGLFANFPPALELIAEYWQEVGIEMRPNTIDRSFYVERRTANLHDASVWGGGGDVPTALSLILAPALHFPTTHDSSFAIPWADWYTSGGEEGEEPPESAQRQMALYDELQTTVEPEQQEQLMREILQIAKEEFYVMGVVQLPPGYGIVKNNFHNVPESMPEAWRWPTPAPTRPEQYYIE